MKIQILWCLLSTPVHDLRYTELRYTLFSWNKATKCSMVIEMAIYIYDWFVENSTALWIVQGMHWFLVQNRWVARQIGPAHCLNLASKKKEVIKDDCKDIKCNHTSVHCPLSLLILTLWTRHCLMESRKSSISQPPLLSATTVIFTILLHVEICELSHS